MSRCLSARAIDHVLLERGAVANSWRTERWDSLRLLTPNWQSRLPDFGYEGDDPDGYRNMPETIAFLDKYAQVIEAPVQTETTVTSLRYNDNGYQIGTDQGDWQCRTVVLATGACNIPTIPKIADAVPSGIAQLTPNNYRNPDQLAEGGVLVVGAAATGTQLADEIHRSGRPVTLSVGAHIRVPRIYRGRDIEWWMDASGLHNELYSEIEDIVRVRRLPSFQLTGSDERKTLDINALSAIGVKLVGRFAGIHDGKAQFAGSLRNMCKSSDLKMNRLLKTFDEWAEEGRMDGEVDPSHRLEPTGVEDVPPLGMDLTSGEIKSVIWATGYRPDYSWLELELLDRKGYIKHDGGVVDDAPGMYLMGMQFLRRRKSALIDGAGDDARDLCSHLAGYLANGNIL